MTLQELYRDFPQDSERGQDARTLLAQTHWFSSVAEFDPRTADALPMPLSSVLHRIARLPEGSGPESVLKDRLWRITEHARPSLERLFRELNESPRRENAILPLRSVRELDTASFMALARRPGRTIREKLAAKPYLQAVRHFQSIDLPENSLLKAFCERLAELLELRAECLGTPPDDLLSSIRSWLASDEVKAIRWWENLPPNNTLLTHRDYRAVYDAWTWLQSIDDDITKDMLKLSRRKKIVQKWEEYARVYSEAIKHFAETPVFFDYEKFELRPWFGAVEFAKLPRKPMRSSSLSADGTLVCVDLTEREPCYAAMNFEKGNATTSKVTLYPYPLIWQRWRRKDGRESVDVELFNADAVCLNPDAVTISAANLFFAHERFSDDDLNRAARAFSAKIRDTFKSDSLIWLVPDSVNDFELEAIRRNINAFFHSAEPLPRSVAAAMEKVDYSRLREGFSVLVVDTVGGKKCATKLDARFDPELLKRVPATRGYYWERHPPVLSSSEVEGKVIQGGYQIPVLDEAGRWSLPNPLRAVGRVDLNVLRRDPRIGNFASCIDVSDSPVRGGVRLHALQKEAGDIPLWCDQVPELSVKVLVNGQYKRFYLVSRGKTVKPIRGKPVPISIKDTFTLPAGKKYYQLPLFVGENEDDLGYSAKLKSPLFPLRDDLECHLNMTFTYGVDQPYDLVFVPKNTAIPPIRVKWGRTIEEEVTDAPAPEYPALIEWKDLRRFPSEDGSEDNDLLDWVEGASDRVDDWLWVRTSKRMSGARVANCGYREPRQMKFLDEKQIGDVVLRFRKSLYFPVIQIWRDGRSISDDKCPSSFRVKMAEWINHLSELLALEGVPDLIKDEIFFLLSCMHKDLPESCVSRIKQQVKAGNVYDKRALGFALGDVSQEWQKNVVNVLLLHPSDDMMIAFAYAIWREPHFVELFNCKQCKSILRALDSRLRKISPCPLNVGWIEAREWIRRIVALLELLLGMMRTRASSNNEIRMLLQPHQQITKDFARQVERLTKIVLDSRVRMFSRVQLGNLPPKQEGDQTPDLLYALRLYLTNDVGANAIRITGVSDSDEDDNGGKSDTAKSTRDNRKGQPSAETIGLFHIKEC